MSGFSEIEEMYLKTMFEIHSDNPAAIVKTTQLAEIKGVSAASVTEMIQRLSSRDMVTHTSPIADVGSRPLDSNSQQG